MRFIFLVCIFLITSCGIFYQSLDSYYTHETELVLNDFLPQLKDINLLLSNEFNGFLYIGRDTCPFCLEFNPILKEFYLYNEDINIYMLDTDFWREHEHFGELLSIFYITSVPSLLHVKEDGQFSLINIDLFLDSELSLVLQDFFY